MNKDMLNFGRFCDVTSTKLEDNGLPEGTTVFISGTQVLPITEDGYTQRIYMVVCPIVDKTVHTGLFQLVDPSSLAPVSKGRQKRLTKRMEEQFEEKTNEAAA